VGLESTVLDLCSDEITVLRPGGISREEIEAVLCINVMIHQSAETANEQQLHSPGMMKSHYAPTIPLYLYTGDEITKLPFVKNEACLFFTGKSRDAWAERNGLAAREIAGNVLTLSESGSALEAAASLFDCLHRLDRNAGRASCIRAEILPEEGLGAAVNDRLSRAAARRYEWPTALPFQLIRNVFGGFFNVFTDIVPRFLDVFRYVFSSLLHIIADILCSLFDIFTGFLDHFT
jgi:L-threonylcarbamoyladenylate synthase